MSEPRTDPCLWCGTPLMECGDPPCCEYNDHPYPTVRETLAALHDDVDKEGAATLEEVERVVRDHRGYICNCGADDCPRVNALVSAISQLRGSP